MRPESYPPYCSPADIGSAIVDALPEGYWSHLSHTIGMFNCIASVLTKLAIKCLPGLHKVSPDAFWGSVAIYNQEGC